MYVISSIWNVGMYWTNDKTAEVYNSKVGTIRQEGQIQNVWWKPVSGR